jgi:hypothetical protein
MNYNNKTLASKTLPVKKITKIHNFFLLLTACVCTLLVHTWVGTCTCLGAAKPCKKDPSLTHLEVGVYAMPMPCQRKGDLTWL